MAFQPCPAIAQVVLRYGSASTGQFLFANVLHAQHSLGDNWTLSDLEALVSEFASWFVTTGDGILGAGYQLLNIESRSLAAEEAPFFSLTVAEPGTLTGEMLPINACLCITLRSAVTGRNGRGRIYAGGLTEGQSIGSVISTGAAGTIDAAYVTLKTSIEENTAGRLCILSRRTGGVLRSEGIGYDVESIGLRDNVIDTQRRRIDRLK